MNVDELDKNSILDDEVFENIISEKDPVFRAKIIDKLMDKAQNLGVKLKFEKLLKAFEKREKQSIIEIRNNNKNCQSFSNWTNFNNPDYPDQYCENYFADENGIKTFNMYGEETIITHPILIAGIFTNLETKILKLQIAFKRYGSWTTQFISRGDISSNSKIVNLSNFGVCVTSGTAQKLSEYLVKIDQWNENIIPRKMSTGKLGWINNDFIPYDKNIEFDGNLQFESIVDDLKEKGSWEKWLDFVLKIRQEEKKIDPKIMMASSFASIIIKKCVALPFFVHLFGKTGGGKTLSLMASASIWGNPSLKSNYYGDFISTPTAIEIRADMLNHIPFFMDDTAKVKDEFNNEFSKTIYKLCSGKGKDRSNRDLGINRPTSWHCAFLTSGEQPITQEWSQAGAINRVIEIEAQQGKIFEDGASVAKLFNNNYGFAGKKFVEIIKELGDDEIQLMQQGFLKKIMEYGKLEKQSISLSIILTADKIATDYIFKDGKYINIDSIVGMLKTEDDISEEQKCYEFICNEVGRNFSKFSNNAEKEMECWGVLEESGSIVFLNANVFQMLCKNNGFHSNAFLKWAKYKKLLISDKGRNDKTKKIRGQATKCICLRILENSEISQEEMEKLPF